MPKRVLAIGVGGSGKAALTILKERLEESYGQVPDNVVLLSLDTDSLRDVDRFAGTRLNPQFDDRGRLPEFQQVVSPTGMTMDTVFADIRSGKTANYMSWLEHEKLDRILGPAERDIRGGAQQRRPIGRTALVLCYANPVYQSIVEAIGRMYGEPEQEKPVDAKDVERSKRLIFVIGSVAGGTGSGMFIDVANLIRHAIRGNPNWQSVSVSAVIVLPEAFAMYTRFMDDPTNLKPNSFAALRELDRFMRVHSSFLPYMIRYAENQQSVTWSTNRPFDHVYLVDTASRSASQDFDLSGDPMRGVFPVIADFVMAHVDNSLGDALATLRSNAGMHYNETTGRMYSSFNVMTYIFPVNDVIESFAYRFVRELLLREFLPVTDEKRRAALRQEALGEVERSFTESIVAGRANPAIVRKAIVATRRVNPEPLDVSWQGLFGLVSLSDVGFAEDSQLLQQSLDYLQGNLILTKDGDYKRESFEEGATRLLNFAEQFQDDYLGLQVDPDDPESRAGGDWDVILGKYREALRVRFAEALDAMLLDVLNRRDANNVLLPHRLPYARELLAVLKGYLVACKTRLEDLWREQQVETRWHQVGEELLNAITWMNDSRGKMYLPPFATEPRKAQESFRGLFVERMSLALHRRVYRLVLDVLDSLGAAEKDSSGQRSVLDLAALELENWELTLADVDRLIAERSRQHEAEREEKRTVKVRRYLTDPKFEDELYRRPEHLGVVATRIMGQVGDQKGLQWARVDEGTPLGFKLVTTWGEAARGAEQIARSWFDGSKDLFQVVRNNVTVAERLAASFNSHAAFTNRCLLVQEPFLRYNPAKNDTPPFAERYVSFNVERARDDAARQFLTNARATLGSQGLNVDTAAESLVACTVVQVSRGIKLVAADPYVQCEPEYWAKLSKGRESIHLFPEEQNATVLEQMIPKLGETRNVQRVFAPELVIALGNRPKVRAFVLAYASGLIYPDTYVHPQTKEQSIELWLRLKDRRIVLSQSSMVRRLDTTFVNLPPEEQEARLLLNALQNYMLKLTNLPGFSVNMIEWVKADLQERGVSLEGIENPFTLTVDDVNEAVNEAALALGPTDAEEKDPYNRRARNALRRLERLEQFISGRLTSMKQSLDPRTRDLGTMMHLVLLDEIEGLRPLTRQVR